MKSLKLFGIVSAILTLLSCGNNSTNFRIDIHLEIQADIQFILYRLSADELVPVDSANSVEKGVFRLRGKTDNPEFFMIRFLENEKIYLVLQPNDKLDIKIDNSQPRPIYHVKGSSESLLIRDLIFRQEMVLREITNLSNEYENIKSNSETFYHEKLRIDSLYHNLLEHHKQYTIDFIKKNPRSLACILALYQNFGRHNIPLFDKYTDLDLFNQVDSNLTILYPHTEAVITLNKDVTDVKEQIKYNKIASKQLETGRPVKAIKDITINGDSINTLANRYNYQIICFWAVWNKESIEVISRINNLHKKYSWRKVRFISISLDKSEVHLEEYLKNNNIEVPVICDYKYWDSDYVLKYGLRKIPYIFIIDDNHFLLQKNIRIDELEDLIKELI